MQNIEIRIRQGDTYATVQAARLEGGLALHRSLTNPKDWVITHAPSGLAVWPRCSKRKGEAELRFNAVLALADTWDMGEQEIKHRIANGLGRKLKALMDNPPSLPVAKRGPRPPIRIAERPTAGGSTIENPVWWEKEGLSVEGDPKVCLTITHEATGKAVAILYVGRSNGVTRAKVAKWAERLLALPCVAWTRADPLGGKPPSEELKALLKEIQASH